MKTQHRSVFLRLLRRGAGAAAYVFLLSVGPGAFAQSSVEKSETSQQARAPESELERAKAVVTKPNEPRAAPPETGRAWGVYSTTSSVEVGYRFEDTDGSRARYLSEVNVRDGLRLLDYSLDMRARPGTGLLFDFLKADIHNAGGDPTQYYSLRADKTRAYRFDARVRRFNYFRIPGPEFALGTREHDLRQQFSDFNLKLFPQRKVRVNLGYSRSMAKGRFTPSYSFERDLFQLIGDQRWEANDFRAGIDASYRGWDFGFEAAHRGFRNDPQIGSRAGVDPGLNLGTPPPPAAISFLERDTPYRSRSVVTRGSVRGSIADRLHVVVRALHDDERSKVPYIETVRGTASNNQNILSRVLTGEGAVKRPGNVVEGGATFEINKNFSIGDAFRYTSYRIAGDVITSQNSLQQAGTGPQQTTITTTLGSQLTDYEAFWNTLELNMNFGRKFAANLGWRVLHRDVALLGQYTSRTSTSNVVTNFPKDEEESQATHAFVGGFRVRPSTRASFFFDVEHGTSNNAFVRINPLEYTRLRVRAQYQLRDNLTLIGTFSSTDRVNPTPQVENEADSRSYTAAVNWEPNSRLMIDAGYDYHDLFSTADIRYFVAGSQLQEGKSVYYSRINSVFANARFGVTNRLDLLLVYYYIMDRGAPTVTIGPNDFVSALPLHRHNPEARLAYRFNNRVTGNLSYRHYSYNERDLNVQDYRANILTTSVRFTF